MIMFDNVYMSVFTSGNETFIGKNIDSRCRYWSFVENLAILNSITHLCAILETMQKLKNGFPITFI